MGKGKWDEVVKTLQKLPFELRESSDYQVQIDLFKGTIEDRSPEELARVYARLRTLEDRIEARAKKCRLKLRAFEQLIEEVYEAKKIKKIDLKEGGSLGVQLEPYAFVKDKMLYQKWCIDNGYLPKMHLVWSSTNSIAKEALEAGQDTPPGVDIFVKTKCVLRK